MQIPIENIYYLLCYSWNKLDEKDRINISVNDETQLVDLFAKILINATKLLLKRGVDKNYTETTDQIPGVKGKVNFTETIKRNLLLRQKTICTFDELSSNILSNQILVSTIQQLIRTKGLDKPLKEELIGLLRMLNNIDFIEIKSSLFKMVKLNRNNRFYGFVMDVCQIIHESSLPTEQKGAYVFSDFTRDEKKMNQLFEGFVRNFYKLEQTTYSTVKKETIYWQFKNASNESMQYLPQMETDITLESEDKKIIMDAKYYTETMNIHYDAEKIKSANLYQLFGYLINQQSDSSKTLNATGILLYPTTTKEYDLKYSYKGHDIYIRTVNLDSNWRQISNRLIDIIQIP